MTDEYVGTLLAAIDKTYSELFLAACQVRCGRIDGKTYARVTNYFFPLVIVAATGFVDRYHVFAFGPVE